MSWSELNTNQKIYTVMSILTGLMHVAFAGNFSDIDVFGISMVLLFVLNGIGFLVVIIVHSFTNVLADQRFLMRIFLLIWTIGSILGWILYHPGDTLIDSSLMNKAIEAVLLIFLVLDLRK